MSKMRIDPVTAQRLGVPEFVEPWHFNLISASVDPAAYADVITGLEPPVLCDCLASWQAILDHAEHDIAYFVPEHLKSEFVGMVERAQAIVAAELVSRGLSIPELKHRLH